MTKLIVMRRGGGGNVAVNPERVTHICSAAGAFTDIFFDGHQVAVEGTFEEVVARLAAPEGEGAGEVERRAEAGERRLRERDGLVFGRPA